MAKVKYLFGFSIPRALKAVITPEKVKNVDAVVKEILNRGIGGHHTNFIDNEIAD